MQLPYYMWYEAAHAMMAPARALTGSVFTLDDGQSL